MWPAPISSSTDRFGSASVQGTQPEFKAAGLRFPSLAERVDHPARMVAELRHLMSDETYRPRPEQRSGPPILLAGHSNRVITLAARHADVVGLLGISTTKTPRAGDVGRDVFAERIA